ncbi:A disintegrin and metalloproteinase with thrombospondin motifs adt-1-like isoform X8 [Haliotis rufescens]|uniref:A disintegrin and metalloproteinase with thrombospondin motifs adt-1-like isoform X8 n=1 Tax=Haliotis rufescens TaxID=6454 RepID=UPI00201F54EC|nr:A disintegrin and metalloproteinase with thrombospondin motifs adt-1-like isoform X8 [Haliotis rufescens]
MASLFPFLAIFLIPLVSGSHLTNRVFKWTITEPVGYVSVGRRLEGHWFYQTYKKDVSLCAYQCLRKPECLSFNYESDSGKCILNRKNHQTVALINAPSNYVSYHAREEYSIDREALGPCADDVCHSHGRCLETKTTDDQLVAICVCNKGWGGPDCNAEELQPQWGTWQDWDDCSVTCDQGWRMRRRNCEDGSSGQTLSPLKCYGRDIEYGSCQLQACPRWDSWGVWGTCSTYQTCGRGYKVRNRTCNNGGTPGVDRYCLGPTNETTVCYSMDCQSPVRLRGGSAHGEGRVEIFNDEARQWGMICGNQWTQTMADLVCKHLGMPGAHMATQNSQFGIGDLMYGVTSLACQGLEQTVQMCERNPWSLTPSCPAATQPAGVMCRVNGVWSLWGEWGDCSVSCETGIQQRTRSCNHPPALHGGKDCEGETVQTKSCTLDMCPVDGVWKTWAAWSECSTSCGKGSQWRQRTCEGPFYHGQECQGERRQTQECQVRECPVDGSWLPWHDWRDCSVTCGGGQQIRKRDCLKPKFGGSNCEGESQQTRQCSTQECPVDASWLTWGQWGECNETCGGGNQRRMRICQEGLNGGRNCSGPAEDFQTCNTHACPVDGVWREWNEWSACSHRCDTGTQTRNRTCDGPYYGGSDCVGSGSDVRNCNTHTCAVDGVWTSWSNWSVCPVTCGGSTSLRSRSCDGPYFGGINCNGLWSEGQPCGTEPCPIDGVWTTWSTWGLCNVTCGGGSQSRSRSCIEPQFGGKVCEGDGVQLKRCNDNQCPIDGVFQTWEEWGACSVTCGGGQKMRSRKCTGPFYGGGNCTGPWEDRTTCSNAPCPVDGTWLSWGTFSECDLTCGGGIRSRRRECDGPFFGGADCSGNREEQEVCSEQNCPVDGEWQNWEIWGTCSTTCGGGIQLRQRECMGPFWDGQDCSGDSKESRDCNTQSCPEDGYFNDWAQWSLCDVTCGGGIRWRNRTCSGPFYGGADCDGARNESEACNDHNCPVDGIFNDWSDWDACSATCGGGDKLRQRTCHGPFYGGKDCVGPREDTAPCNQHNCPVDGIWAEWAKWSTCTLTCGGGQQWRSRNCIGPFDGGKECPGPRNVTQACSTDHCPIDGVYGEWSSWGACSDTCGGGTQDRTRSCTAPKFGGVDCQDPAVDTMACNTNHCPVDGVWLDWSKWGECSATCGGGSMKRVRVCDPPKYGGADCVGDTEELESCNPNLCPIPGDWFTWEQWSTCSVTCGGGTKSRSRTCDMASHGNLTSPCEGPNEETIDCHTFACTPLARTCSEWGVRGLLSNTMADIDPDEAEGLLEPTRVYCDMTSQDGAGVTVIGHDSEEEEEVVGYEGAGEYVLGLNYNVTLDHAIAIIDASENCRQFVQWRCKAALIHNPNGNGIITTGWRNRTGGIADYFGDATPGSGMCTCGMTQSCADPTLACNCDMNDDVWREDSGYLSYRPDLPVTEFIAGDTGDDGTEAGAFRVGPVECFGASSTDVSDT